LSSLSPEKEDCQLKLVVESFIIVERRFAVVAEMIDQSPERKALKRGEDRLRGMP